MVGLASAPDQYTLSSYIRLHHSYTGLQVLPHIKYVVLSVCGRRRGHQSVIRQFHKISTI